jgi:DNA repair protein SbcD/Mre11
MANVCPVVIAKGNHDRKLDLDLMRRISARFPIIVEEGAGVHYVAGAAVGVMAWPERATLAAAYREFSQAELDQTAQDLLRNVLRGLGQQMAAHDGPRILAGHFMVEGSVTSVGQPLVGQSMNVGLADLALAGAPLVLMGHIHKPQEWQFGGCEILYTGSPYRTAYGEVEQKSIVLAEYDGPKLLGWRRIPTPCAPMILLEDEWGQVFDDSPKRGWMVGDALPDNIIDAEVRFRYSVAADMRDEASAAAEAIKAALIARGALDCKVEERVRSVNNARAPEVAKALTLDAKLAAYWAARGTTPDEERAATLLSMAHEIEQVA